MKVLIFGSRHVTDMSVLEEAIRLSSINVKNITNIISGCARGADALGEQWAIANNIPILKYPADWDKHGKSAGYIRNAEMAKVTEFGIALWDGESKGTKHMIDLLKDRICLLVHRVDKP